MECESFKKNFTNKIVWMFNAFLYLPNLAKYYYYDKGMLEDRIFFVNKIKINKLSKEMVSKIFAYHSKT